MSEQPQIQIALAIIVIRKKYYTTYDTAANLIQNAPHQMSNEINIYQFQAQVISEAADELAKEMNGDNIFNITPSVNQAKLLFNDQQQKLNQLKNIVSNGQYLQSSERSQQRIDELKLQARQINEEYERRLEQLQTKLNFSNEDVKNQIEIEQAEINILQQDIQKNQAVLDELTQSNKLKTSKFFHIYGISPQAQETVDQFKANYIKNQIPNLKNLMPRPQYLVQAINNIVQNTNVSISDILALYRVFNGRPRFQETGILNIKDSPDLISRIIYCQQLSTSKTELDQIKGVCEIYSMQNDQSDTDAITKAVANLASSNWNEEMMIATKDWVKNYIASHPDQTQALVLQSRNVRIQGSCYPTDQQDHNVIINMLVFLALMRVDLDVRVQKRNNNQGVTVIGIIKNKDAVETVKNK